MDILKGTINDLQSAEAKIVEQTKDAVDAEVEKIKKILSSYKVVVTLSLEPK